jgi:hypothetical protein
MDVDEFWLLVETTGSEDPEGRAQRLTDRLAAHPEAEIESFAMHLDAARERLDTFALWGAAYLVCDGLCGDDGFYYFQAWLIGLGRQAFERIAIDPDELAELPAVQRLAGRAPDGWAEDEWPQWESLDYVANQAHERRTGREDSLDDALKARGYEYRCGSSPDPSDAGWNFDDPSAVIRRLPRLSRLFTLSPRSARAARGKAALAQVLAERGQTEEEFMAELQQGAGQ